MEILENKRIAFIDGYLNALADIDCTQDKNLTRAFMKKKDGSTIKKFLKEKFLYTDNLSFIKEITYRNSTGLYYFLENMILPNLCFLSSPSKNQERIREEQDNYRKYIISHLMDYIDFAFEGIGIYSVLKDITISLLECDKNSFIVLAIKKEDFELLLVFLKKNLNHKEFALWFDKLTKYYEGKTKEKSPNKILKDNDILSNGLTVKVGKEVFEPLMRKAIENGYLDEVSKKTLLKYFPIEKIEELEKVLFEKETK